MLSQSRVKVLEHALTWESAESTIRKLHSALLSTKWLLPQRLPQVLSSYIVLIFLYLHICCVKTHDSICWFLFLSVIFFLISNFCSVIWSTLNEKITIKHHFGIQQVQFYKLTAIKCFLWSEISIMFTCETASWRFDSSVVNTPLALASYIEILLVMLL